MQNSNETNKKGITDAEVKAILLQGDAFLKQLQSETRQIEDAIEEMERAHCVYVLERRMDSYYSNNLWLGVFRSEAKAREAQQQYMDAMAKSGDPHHDQGYFKANLAKDLKITKHKTLGRCHENKLVYLVENESFVMFGQGSASIVAIASTLEEAQEEADLGNLSQFDRQFPDGFHVLTLPLDTLHLNGFH